MTEETRLLVNTPFPAAVIDWLLVCTCTENVVAPVTMHVGLWDDLEAIDANRPSVRRVNVNADLKELAEVVLHVDAERGYW